ncbi:MAG: phage head morphogenesis protein [Treponema sp.]|jgi:SPP1 gp7 family putative phage head morphogenesis protein|nr:phage head morphogenesis protein [Treponema sp.]
MWHEEHATAFTVAKTMQLDVLSDLHTAVVEAMEQGQSFETFKKTIKPVLQQKGWWGKKDMIDPLTGETVKAQLGSYHRLQTIYRVTMKSAYQKGQYKRTMASDLHPYLMYRIGPSVHHREEHKSWDGLILPKDDPWWDSHFPPNGWGCKCYTRTVTEARLRKYQAHGIPVPPPADGSGGGRFRVKTVAPEVQYKTYINKRTGRVEQVPEGIDPAFNWQVGKANRGRIGEQALEGARNRYAKTTTGQGIQGILDQALSAVPGPPSPYEVPILITRNQKYARLSLDEAIHRELGYLQDETRKTGKEYMTLMAQGGNRLLGTWSSGKTSTKIFLSEEIRYILKAQGTGTLCLLHSHPNNSGFSDADMAIMCKYPSIKMMGLVL